MRLITIIILTGIMMLASLSQLAEARSGMHHCASCVEAVALADHQAPAPPHQTDATCADMATCTPLALLDNSPPLRSGDLLRPRHAWPEPRDGTTVRLSLNLPPPRI